MGNVESSKPKAVGQRQAGCSPTHLACLDSPWNDTDNGNNNNTATGATGNDGVTEEKPKKNVRMDAAAVENVSKPKNNNRGAQGQAEDSAHTFAASLASQSGHYRRGTDFIMITDALSDVRVNYHIDPNEIGHGHYGVVRKCMHRESMEWYAIKSIRKSKVSKIEVLKREIEILKEVKHPNIIELIEVYEDERYLHLITELCTGGELFDRIIAKTQCSEGHFSEHDAAKLIGDITDAIRYCHEIGIVHRDLKPENFLFKTEAEDSPIKIIDFGLSRHDDTQFGIMQTKVGTPYYVAPEVLRREYTKSCDIWSIGVITYILLCGYPPFYGDSDTQIFECVRAGRFDFPSPEWDDISESAKNFVTCLLRKDPKDRPLAAVALEHIWIQEQLGDESPVKRQVKHTRKSRADQFSRYLAMKKLKKATLGLVASNLTQSEVGTLEIIFREVDETGNGKLTLTELDHAISRGNFSAELQDSLKNLRKQLEISEEETLDWKDFLAATMDKSVAMREDNIRSVFNHFKHGVEADHLNFNDLMEIFGGKAQVQEVMDFLDQDGDGMISFEDFRHAIEVTMEEDLEDEEFDISENISS